MAHGVHAPPPMQPGMHRPMPMHGGQMKGMRHGMPMHGGQMKGMHHRMPMPGGHMKGFQRFGRGHFVPPHFRGGQFVVRNWQSFGFPAPMPGGQWIRYYDDALLIDGDGRVMDGRYGWDWDGRGGGMAYEDGGYGDGYAGEEEYGRDDDYDRDEEYAGRGHHGDEMDGDVRVVVRRDGRRGDCRRGCAGVRHLPPPPPHPGYGYGQGYGYGYGYGYGAGCGCGPVVVTETITTTAPVVETRTYYETVYEHRAAPRRHYSKPVVRRSVKSAPTPRPGERG
jgi:Ni/Co efflux regulator RcnB